ncbi:MAG: hypothetical protein AB1898_02315 [Acidobacteriota bacterium]
MNRFRWVLYGGVLSSILLCLGPLEGPRPEVPVSATGFQASRIRAGTTVDPRRGPDGSGPATGSIQGTVQIQSRIQPRSMAFNLYSRRGRSVPPPAPSNELEHVVIFLEGDRVRTALRPEGQTPRSNVTIEQVNETFVPQVLAVQTGTTVLFPNSDPFFHNVFSLSSARRFDLGRYPKGEVRSVRFNNSGIVKVFCHIHSHMNAVIYVFDHPYYCIPNAEGHFSIGHVPVGTYTLVAWHERLNPVRKTITVAEDSPLSLLLSL